MKEAILKDWSAWRIIKILLAVFFIISGIVRSEYIISAAGAYLALQAIFNLGCAGGSCNVK